ncbi:MAG: HDOD domain-containing protein [Syntrophobacteraceae bacterium]
MIPENSSLSLLDMVKEYAASEKLNLPIFPKVAYEVQRMVADDTGSIDALAEVIGKDQALASQTLKLANSAFFAGMNRVKTIREALLRLGLNQVRNFLVIGWQHGLYKSKDALVERYLQILWKHALATAKGSKWLLQKIGYPELADEGFLAGLLHDIGKLLLLRVIEVINSEDPDTRLSEEFIMEILHSMHVEQGFTLMNEWSIPTVYCDVARDHHLEDFNTGDILLMAVRIANQVCRKAGISTIPDQQLIPASLPEVHILAVREIVLAELEVVIEDALEFEA